MRYRVWTPVAAILAAMVMAAEASAGAWTRPRGEALLIYSLGYHWLESGPAAFTKQETAIYGEYGWRNYLTVVARAGFQQMDRADRVDDVLLHSGGRGVGGLEAGARLRLRRTERWSVSGQLLGLIPGTGENRTNAPFGRGGGGADLRIMAGRSIGRSSFVDIQAGWRARPDAPVSEYRLDISAGTHVARGLRAFVQTFSVWSDAGGPDGLRNYTGHRLQASLIWPLGSRRHVQVSALTTLHSRNVADETALIVSIWRSF